MADHETSGSSQVSVVVVILYAMLLIETICLPVGGLAMHTDMRDKTREEIHLVIIVLLGLFVLRRLILND